MLKILKKLERTGHYEYIYLLRGKILPDYDSRELGLSGKLVMKAISKATGVKSDEIVKEYNKIGDLGKVAEVFVISKKQSTLLCGYCCVSCIFNGNHSFLHTAVLFPTYFNYCSPSNGLGKSFTSIKNSCEKN